MSNIAEDNDSYAWDQTSMLEVILPDPDSFLKIKETLTRIGVASKKEKVLYQSVHILHKRGQYYLMSFLELFALDGKSTTLQFGDIKRRNKIAYLLETWGLCKVVPNASYGFKSKTEDICVLNFKDSKSWKLVAKYTLGNR